MGNNESTPTPSNSNQNEDGNPERNQRGFDWEKALKIGVGLAAVAGAVYLLANLTPSETAEKLFFLTVFEKIDKFGSTSSLKRDYEAELERNQKACENKDRNEKIRRLDWTNITELGIPSYLDRFNGYIEVLKKIPKFLKNCHNLPYSDLRDLIEKAAKVLEYRREDLKPGSKSFSTHQRVISEWDNLKHNLEDMY